MYFAWFNPETGSVMSTFRAVSPQTSHCRRIFMYSRTFGQWADEALVDCDGVTNLDWSTTPGAYDSHCVDLGCSVLGFEAFGELYPADSEKASDPVHDVSVS